MKKKVLAAFLVLVVAGVAFLYFPRGTADAFSSAVLGVLNGGMAASRGGGTFAAALDGEIFATGDVVKADTKGRGLLTFFDGSTLSVDPNAQVRVESLDKGSDRGIQLVLEQTAGKTWASVQKLSPASKFEVKTPTLVATVRGTTFEVIVERKPDGTVTTTIKCDEGEVVVQAVAGGTVTVGAGQQVEVAQGQTAPAQASPQPPSPKLRFTAPAGVGFVVLDPAGRQCGATGGVVTRQVPRCAVSGTTATIGEVTAGTYTLLLTAAQPVTNGEIVAEGLGIAATDFSTKLTQTLAVGTLARTTLPVTVAGDGKLGSTGFTPVEVLANVCGAEATGHVFSGGGLTERADAVVAYGLSNKGQPIAVVYTQDELDREAANAGGLPLTISDVKVSIDIAGVHLAASVSAGPITVPLTADVVAGVDNGTLEVRLRSLEAGFLPPAVTDLIASRIDDGLAQYAATLPIAMERVALRSGCLALIGKTPN